MAMTPVLNPDVPAKMETNGMFVGKTICVYGKIHDDAERFAVNLYSGDDIALHINPRFENEVVVRNTRQGDWGSEERDGGFPFKQGKLFGIRIKCEKDGFEIRCNHYKTYARYSHRLPFSSITHVEVAQNCDVMLVCSTIDGVSVPAQVIETPPVPAKFEIPFHNIKRHTVVVVGKPTSSDGRFAINFKDDDKIHFHFNPRMGDKQIVRNSFDGSWASEDRGLDTPFPFENGVPFEVSICVLKGHFEVKINGSHAFSFDKRLRPLNRMREITVNGDVDIEKVTFY